MLGASFGLNGHRGSVTSLLSGVEGAPNVEQTDVIIRDELPQLMGPEFRDSSIFEIPDSYNEQAPLRPYIAPSGRDVGGTRIVPPSFFDFVENSEFQLTVGLVVLVNMGTIFSELIHPDSKDYWYMDQVILAFYTLEVTCRILHFKHRFFDHPTDRYWHWIDLGIVIFGVVDEWLVPLVLDTTTHHPLVSGAARTARLLRAIKLMRIFCQAGFAWTESTRFQSLVGTIIACNAVIMGIETDNPSPLWWWVDQGMLLFFVFEISVRIKMAGCRFFLDPQDQLWNVLDFSIVALGVADLWASRIVELLMQNDGTGQDGNTIGRLMMLARMLRLMRLLRLLRLVKAVRPLYTLAMGVTQAMQSMFWVLVLTAVVLFAFAILVTRMVGHKLLFNGENEIPEETRELFQTIPDSMFTLFSLMNGQQWAAIEPLLDKAPITKIVFVIFTISSSWALLSVMTGVLCDHMMSVRTAQEMKDDEAQQERRSWLHRWLRGIFAAADKDGSGALAKDEYMELLRMKFHVKKVQQAANVPVQDLKEMFTWLDVDGDGEIQFSEFLEGFDWLTEPIRGKSLLKIEHIIRSRCATLRGAVEDIRGEVNRMADRQEIMHQRQLVQLRSTLEARKRLAEATLRSAAARNDVVRAQADRSYAENCVESREANRIFAQSQVPVRPPEADGAVSVSGQAQSSSHRQWNRFK